MKLSHFFYFLLFLSSCKKVDNTLTKITAKTIAIDTAIVPSKTIENIIAPYKEKLTKDMQEVLTYTPINLTKESTNMQSTLGNLMADMCFEMGNGIFKKNTKTSIDFSMLNYGGIRAIITAGAVTKKDAFKLMPFENELVVVKLSGNKVLELVEFFIQNKTAHPLSKNITLEIEENGYSLKINGELFDKNKMYYVLTNDYLQSGGDKMDFFKNPEALIKLDYKVRDAIIQYFKKVDTLKVAIDNRVKLK